MFSGTATDLREADTTQTAASEMLALMSEYLCHISKASDKHYRVQNGGPDSIKAFQFIEIVQTHSKCEGDQIRSFSNGEIVNTTHSNCTSIQQN